MILDLKKEQACGCKQCTAPFSSSPCELDIGGIALSNLQGFSYASFEFMEGRFDEL